MQKTFPRRIFSRWLFMATSLFFLGAQQAFSQSPVYVDLTPENSSTKMKSYFIDKVEGTGTMAAGFGQIYTSRESKVQISFEGDPGVGILDYINKSHGSPDQEWPVTIRVDHLSVSEQSKNGSVQGELKVHLGFYLQAGDSLVHLADFKGGANYQRSPGKYSAIPSSLKRSFENSIAYLNEWFALNEFSHPLLAKGVQVNIMDYTGPNRGDTVFYSKDQVLKWSDFKARPHAGSKFAASIFTSFAWEGNTKVVDGVLQLDFWVKVFMLQQSSWVKSTAKNDYGLAHEQLHFDITKLVVERFKENLLQEEMDPSNYDAQIGYWYIETYREMNKLQEQYDSETSHGQNKAAQARWRKFIDEELAKY